MLAQKRKIHCVLVQNLIEKFQQKMSANTSIADVKKNELDNELRQAKKRKEVEAMVRPYYATRIVSEYFCTFYKPDKF